MCAPEYGNHARDRSSCYHGPPREDEREAQKVTWRQGGGELGGRGSAAAAVPKFAWGEEARIAEARPEAAVLEAPVCLALALDGHPTADVELQGLVKAHYVMKPVGRDEEQVPRAKNHLGGFRPP